MSPKNKKVNKLDEEIEKLYKVLNDTPVDDGTYDMVLAAIERLEKLRNERVRTKTSKRRVDPNTVISMLGELVGMGFIMNFERLHVLSTKAFTRLWRPRI